MKLLTSSSVLQVGVRQFGKENLALYLKSVDYNGNMSIVNTIIIKLLCQFFSVGGYIWQNIFIKWDNNK